MSRLRRHFWIFAPFSQLETSNKTAGAAGSPRTADPIAAIPPRQQRANCGHSLVEDCAVP
jgi:hypothetical protein